MKNHIFTVSSGPIQIDRIGLIRTNRFISTLTDQFYNFTVMVSDSKCQVSSTVGVYLKACDNPSVHMFNSKGMYEVKISEDRPVGSEVLTVRINGNQNRTFSIMGVAANEHFSINILTGK